MGRCGHCRLAGEGAKVPRELAGLLSPRTAGAQGAGGHYQRRHRGQPLARVVTGPGLPPLIPGGSPHARWLAGPASAFQTTRAVGRARPDRSGSGTVPWAGLDANSPVRIHLLLWSPCCHSQPQSAQACHMSAGPCPSLPGIPGLPAPWGSNLQPRPGEGVWGLGWAAAASGGAGISLGHQVRSPGSVWPVGTGWPLTPEVWEAGSCCGSEFALPESVLTEQKGRARGLSGPPGGRRPVRRQESPPPCQPPPCHSRRHRLLPRAPLISLLFKDLKCAPDKADKHASRPWDACLRSPRSN